MLQRLCVVACGLVVAVSAHAGSSFVNWETPHVNPLDLTPDGSKLLAVNTADNRLEVFTVRGGSLTHAGSVPVGLDPVSVRVRTSSEAWVVNQISDSVSIVNLSTMNVIATLSVGDEPADVVFAGLPQKAFVSISQLNQVKVYDPLNLAVPPAVINIAGEDPRALATDGANVYAAIFESGNRTTVLPQTVVSSSGPYAGHPNPPPNMGTQFSPAIAAGLPAPPPASLIVKKDAAGAWRDDNNRNWSSVVTWDVHDHDVAIINATTLAVTYVTGVMNLNMNLSVKPGGQVAVVGTDAINNIRFEPNLSGRFIRVKGATFATSGGTPTVVDLNPHLTYASPSISQAQRDQSIGDPRSIDWNAAGTRGYISGMGSNNLLVVDGSLGRVGLVEVGHGPTGVRVLNAANRVFVLNKFDASISVVDATSLSEIARPTFYDPTPQAITAGRPFLYDTHRTSGLGQASCASCHIDGRMDQIAWDLGNPQGSVQPFVGICNGGLGGCENPHPMKGPMTTQTLIGIIGTEPFHWRGDRTDLIAFNPAFINLMGDDVQLTSQEMNELIAFVATLTPPPNPNRNFDGSLPTSLPNGGNAVTGSQLFNTVALNAGLLTCAACHALPTGTNGTMFSGPVLMEAQTMKVPQLRNMYEKTGFSATSMNNNRGFGFVHDGSVDSLISFLNISLFAFAPGAEGMQQRRDVEAFLLSFATDTHAAVGAQTTVVNGASLPASQTALIASMLSLADDGSVGVVVKGRVSGLQRGYAYLGGGQFQSDRAAETLAGGALQALGAPGSELTWTVVPANSQTRIGIDRDEDGYFDRDEVDAGSDPADPDSVPGTVCPSDLNGDGTVNSLDLGILLSSWSIPAGTPGCSGALPCPADINHDGFVNSLDLGVLLASWSIPAGSPGCQ